MKKRGRVYKMQWPPPEEAGEPMEELPEQLSQVEAVLVRLVIVLAFASGAFWLMNTILQASR